jgi:hypothetical protein
MNRDADQSGDSGASLLIVLVIITTVALVMGVILGETGTSLKTSVALRDQVGAAYNGDGAAQVAVNTLRKSTFANDVSAKCFGSGATSSDTLSLPNFYPGTNGQQGSALSSAAVTCSAEAGTGAQGSPVPVSSANKPGNAVLTLSTTEVGQTYGQSNKDVTIHGGVISDSSINSDNAKLKITGNGVGANAVGPCSGSVTPACTHNPGVSDPNYPAPTTLPVKVPVGSMPACTNKNQVAEFVPGLYTTADTFNNCKASWLYFAPGLYYFDFTTGSHVWSVDTSVVGGALSAAKTNTAPAVPGACVNPITSVSAVGVEFAFGGDSQVTFDKGSNFEICATYSKTSIPTVAYGLKSDIGSGANTARGENGCIQAVGSGNCNLFNVRVPGDKPEFYFEGFVYAPRATADLSVNNTSAQHFNFGVVFRTLALATTGSADTTAIISLPDNSLGYGTASTIVDLSVYVCPGASTCSSSTGHLQLIARVLVNDPTGTPVSGAREIKVLSWSNIR